MNFIDAPQNEDANVSCIGIRPEHITLSTEQGTWAGTVGVIEHLGSESFLHINIEGKGTVTVKADGDCPLKYGDSIYLSAPAGKVLKFDNNGLTIR